MSLRSASLNALIVLASVTSLAKAQFVFIPDTNLRMWFNTWAPGCVDASGQLDTLNSDFTYGTAPSLQVDWAPSDLTGIQYISTAEEFLIGYNTGGPATISAFPDCNKLILNDFPGSEIPELPAGVIALEFHDAPLIETLPVLPSGLHYLELRSFPLLAQTGPLPLSLYGLNIVDCVQLSQPLYNDSLHQLSVSNMPWTALGALPNTLVNLDVEHLPNVQLPPQWPDSLRALDLVSIPATELPPFPSGVIEVRLEHIPISSLPPIQSAECSIRLLSDTLLSTLPALQVPNVTMLHLEDLPLLNDLPVINGSVQAAELMHLPLVQHIDLPFMDYQDYTWLTCTDMALLDEIVSLGNSLTALTINTCPLLHCLPTLPEEMLEFTNIGNAITCVPNYPSQAALLGMLDQFPPLCDTINSTCTEIMSGSPIQPFGVQPAKLLPVSWNQFHILGLSDGRHQIQVADALGKVVFVRAGQSFGGRSEVFDLGSLPPSAYTISVDARRSWKLVVVQ